MDTTNPLRDGQLLAFEARALDALKTYPLAQWPKLVLLLLGEVQRLRGHLPRADPEVEALGVENLPLSSRARRALLRADSLDGSITTVGELLQQTAAQLTLRRGFANGCLAETRQALADLGLKLKGD